MNILLVNHYAGSVYHGMEYRPYYLAREWVRSGHNVTIVAADQSHLRSIQLSMDASIRCEKIDGISYIWLKTTKYEGNGIKRAINMASFVAGIFRFNKQIIKIGKPDVVVASSTYPLDIFPCHFLAKRSDAKLIYEIHDLWPLSPMELGNMPWYHPFILCMQVAENWCYKYCDAVVSILPKVLDHVTSHGLTPEKLHIVPNGINTEEWQSCDKIPDTLATLIESEKRMGRFIIAYCGQHGVANALNNYVEAAYELREKPITFFLVGKGPEKEKLENYAAKLKLSNVTFIDHIRKSSMPDLLSHFDCLYIGLQREPLFRFGISPNKIMDYMMSGKPVIQAIEAGNDIVAEAECGFSVPAENPKMLAEAIVRMMNTDQSTRKLMGTNGHAYVKEKHDYKILANRFLKIMYDLL